MASKTTTPNKKRSTLEMPREELRARLNEQIKKGRELLVRQIKDEEELESIRYEESRWSDFNAELLRRAIDTDELVESYYPLGGFDYPIDKSPNAEFNELRHRVKYYVRRLESILDRLDLIPESFQLEHTKVAVPPTDHQITNKRIFVVHGHDEEAKQSVARCLEKLGLEAIILHEQANAGRTIIEKFEDYADVEFAIALLTPDDLGTVKNKPDDLRARARQNVIFELGFFFGRLGRFRVCALHKGDVELPSDFSGVLWVKMDTDGAWRFALGKELRAAGLEVDLNRLV